MENSLIESDTEILRRVRKDLHARDSANEAELKAKVEQLEKEATGLKERVAYLENGAFVIEKAAEYAAMCDNYTKQIGRLSSALQKAREAKRKAV